MRRNTIASILNRLVINEPDVLETGCWLWPGRKCAGGYGQVCTTEGFRMVHRWVYEHFQGPIPKGMELDHRCRRRCCANWEHLEPVTHLENCRRGSQYQSYKERCIHDHPLSGDNLGISGGRRVCRACAAEKTRRCRLRKKAH